MRRSFQASAISSWQVEPRTMSSALTQRTSKPGQGSKTRCAFWSGPPIRKIDPAGPVMALAILAAHHSSTSEGSAKRALRIIFYPKREGQQTVKTRTSGSTCVSTPESNTHQMCGDLMRPAITDPPPCRPVPKPSALASLRPALLRQPCPPATRRRDVHSAIHTRRLGQKTSDLRSVVQPHPTKSQR